MHFKGPFQSSLYLVPRTPTARVRSRFKIKTDSTEFYGVGLDWILLSSWRKRTCFYFHVYTCVTEKVQTSTSSPEASRPHSLSQLRHASFHLFSYCRLSYAIKWTRFFFIFLSLSWPNLHRGTMKKERDKEIGSSLAWHARKNSNSEKTYENCTVTVTQGWPNFFTCFRPFLISQFSHGRGMCRILGEKCMF